MSERKFIHCDTDDRRGLTLHDCTAETAYLRDGILGFEFHDGFWITPNNPASNLTETSKTDFARVEFVLLDGQEYEAYVYVFDKNIFGQTVRREWTASQLVQQINSGRCQLEFLYQYIDFNTRLIDCELWINKRPYRKECLLRISASEVYYYWNNLLEDRPW